MNKFHSQPKIYPYIGNPNWVDGTIKEIWDCLNDDTIPQPNLDCEYCNYRQISHKFD